ncbi:MAG TPA: response regulator transcription factor [Acidimicrobiales bacterium]|nr:response regulator transcription factor [Acidimicrobiales bacterium]
MDPCVLVVEDDDSLREVAAMILTDEGYDVETCATGTDALARVHARPPDLVLLDVMLPDLDGLAVCRALRDEGLDLPIVMLTARRAVSDVVAGLDTGADDYVTKPFDATELLARVRAVLRRRAPHLEDARDAIELDVAAVRVWRGGVEVALTATEFRLLRELVSASGIALTRGDLVRRVWGTQWLGNSRLVDMAVKRLRDKLGTPGDGDGPITTVRGVGYRFDGAAHVR